MLLPLQVDHQKSASQVLDGWINLIQVGNFQATKFRMFIGQTFSKNNVRIGQISLTDFSLTLEYASLYVKHILRSIVIIFTILTLLETELGHFK